MISYESVLLFLAAYLPFEEFFLKWLPVSDSTYLWLRQIPDMFVVLLAFSVVMRRSALSDKRVFVLALLVAVLSLYVLFLLYVNDANFVQGVINYKAFVRYTLLLFTVFSIREKFLFYRRLSNLVFYVSIVQIVVGMIQFSGGIPVRDFLAARETTESVLGFASSFTGARYPYVNDLMGTMGNTINYAMFLLVAVIMRMSLYRMTRFPELIYLFFAALCVYLSGSLSVFFVLFAICAFHFSLVYGRSPVYWSLVALCFFVFFYYLAFEVLGLAHKGDVFYVFTSDYIEEARRQRLGVAIYVFPYLLSHVMGFVGYSPDKSIVVNLILHSGSAVPEVLKAVIDKVIEDVYWVALVGYYGLPFVLLLIGFFIYLMTRAFAWIGRERQSGIMLGLFYLLFASLVLNFFNQAFEVRQFSYYFWLTFAITVPALVSYRPR